MPASRILPPKPQRDVTAAANNRETTYDRSMFVEKLLNFSPDEGLKPLSYYAHNRRCLAEKVKKV
jgi:hypothetical protein